MILEVAVLTVKPELTVEFLTAFEKAQLIIQNISGYVSHELQKCIEVPN